MASKEEDKKDVRDDEKKAKPRPIDEEFLANLEKRCAQTDADYVNLILLL